MAQHLDIENKINNFDEWWNYYLSYSYGRKPGIRGNAKKKYDKAIKSDKVSHDFLMIQLQKYLCYCFEDDRLSKDASAWLHQKCYFEDYEVTGNIDDYINENNKHNLPSKTIKKRERDVDKEFEILLNNQIKQSEEVEKLLKEIDKVRSNFATLTDDEYQYGKDRLWEYDAHKKEKNKLFTDGTRWKIKESPHGFKGYKSKVNSVADSKMPIFSSSMTPELISMLDKVPKSDFEIKNLLIQ